MADRAFAERRRNGRGGGGVSDAISRWLLLNYKLTHIKQNLSQNNFSKQAFCACVLPFLLKRSSCGVSLRKTVKSVCFFYIYIFSYHTDKETRRILPLNAPRHLPETRRYLTRVAPLFSPVFVFFFFSSRPRARVCDIQQRSPHL